MEYIDLYPKTEEKAKLHKYKFWDTQPVVRLNEIVGREGVIKEDLERYGDISLNEKLYFKMDDTDSAGISKFISRVKAKESVYPYYEYYTSDHVQYLLNSDHICFTIRSKENDIVVALTLVHIRDYQLNSRKVKLADVRFLTVIKKLRGKHLGSIMIKRLRDILSDRDINIGTFRTRSYIPKPFCTTRIHHRALNIRLLVDNGFTKLSKSLKLKHVQKELELPKEPKSEIYLLNSEQEEDVNTAYNLLMKSFRRYSFHPIFTKEEFVKTFLDNKFVTPFVIRDDKGNITDFCSFARVLYNVKNSKTVMTGSKLYYYTSFRTTPYRMINDLMIIAKSRGSAVFSAYDIMGNSSIIADFEFDKGNEELHYNMYNYKLREMLPEQLCSF